MAAWATVGVAMGSGTDVARESADIVLLGNDLLRFADTVAIARRTRRRITN
jgi:Cu+-exporting ATPase